MLPPPALPLAGQAGLAQNAWVGSTVFLLSGRDWPRYLLGCSLDPLSTTPFQLFTVPGGATALSTRGRKSWLSQDCAVWVVWCCWWESWGGWPSPSASSPPGLSTSPRSTGKSNPRGRPSRGRGSPSTPWGGSSPPAASSPSWGPRGTASATCWSG